VSKNRTWWVSVLAGWLVLAGGCAEPGQIDGLSASPGPPVATAQASPSLSPPPPTTSAIVAPYELGNARKGPAAPIIGTPYPYDLNVHCGGWFLRFGGRIWRTDTPPDYHLRREANGNTKITGFIAGTAELVDQDTARFVMDTRYVDADQPVVLYELTTQKPPTCQ
jgi:hypothetical protein